jgi:hypothetical protein
MSDPNSALPVRTENNGDVVVKVADATTPSQQLAVDASGKVSTKLNDGDGNQVTSQVNGAQRALDVGIDVAGVQIDPRQVRALLATDVVTSNQGAPNTVANAWKVTGTDGTNSQSYTAGGAAHVSADNLPTAVDTNFGAVGASTIRVAAEVGNSTGAADFNNGVTGAQTQRVAANLAVAGANVSTINPVPVTVVSTVPGSPVQDYASGVAVAVASSSTHDYTVSALKSLNLSRIWASSSGKIKVLVSYETAAASGIFNTKFVGFNSTSSPNVDIAIISPFQQVTGAKIRVIITNLDKAAEDVYSTIEGTEI